MVWWKVVRIFVILKLNDHNGIITIRLFTNQLFLNIYLQFIWTKLAMLLYNDANFAYIQIILLGS